MAFARRIAFVLCAWLSTTAALAADAARTTLFGVGEVVVGTDSIRVVKDASLPSGVDIVADGATSVQDATAFRVPVGSGFTVTDRHHVDVAYRLLQIDGDVALVEETRSTHFPGDAAASRSVTTQRVRSYGGAARD